MIPIQRLNWEPDDDAERTTDQDEGDDEVHPAVGLEAVPENCRFEVVRHGPVVAPCPYRVEESHDAGDAQHRPGEEPPATTCFFHDTFPFLGSRLPSVSPNLVEDFLFER